MAEFVVRTAEQLPILLREFRKQAGLTQHEAARRMGISQQALSNLERHADKVSADRLLEVLSLLGAELVLRESSKPLVRKSPTGPRW